MRNPEELRSHRWSGGSESRGFSHRARSRQLGYNPEDQLGKCVILRERAEQVKRGV
ncbi:hypothetical protein AB0E54_18895 [Amycolatopsis coloradensis]|nr:hypothetical protein [Amycolatopsis coloradensis]